MKSVPVRDIWNSLGPFTFSHPVKSLSHSFSAIHGDSGETGEFPYSSRRTTTGVWLTSSIKLQLKPVEGQMQKPVFALLGSSPMALSSGVCNSQSPSGCALQSSFRFATCRWLVCQWEGPVWQLSVSRTLAQCPKIIRSHAGPKDACKVLFSGGGGSQWNEWGTRDGDGVGTWSFPGVWLPSGRTPLQPPPAPGRTPLSIQMSLLFSLSLPYCSTVAGLLVHCSAGLLVCWSPRSVAYVCSH